MIVVDASVAAELALRLEGADVAAARVLDAAESLHAPHLIDLEVLSVLRRTLAARAITVRQAGAALSFFLALPIQRVAHDALADRIWQLRGNLTPYDAAYVALAEGMGVPLITFDARMQRASWHRATIEVLRRT